MAHQISFAQEQGWDPLGPIGNITTEELSDNVWDLIQKLKASRNAIKDRNAQLRRALEICSEGIVRGAHDVIWHPDEKINQTLCDYIIGVLDKEEPL